MGKELDGFVRNLPKTLYRGSDGGFPKIAVSIENDPTTNPIPITSVDLGTKADTVASSDTGTFSLISLFKRLLQKLTAGLTVSGQIGTAIANAFTRTANTTAYTANQVINNATSGAAQQLLTNVGVSNGASGYIRFVLAVGNSTPTPRIRVHVYDTAPTTVKNDAATWALDYSNDASKYLGYIDLDALNGGVATSTSFFMYKCAANSRNLFYELQTLDAFTPASGTGYRLTAVPDQNNV